MSVFEIIFSIEVIWELIEVVSVFVLSSTVCSSVLPNNSKNKWVQFLLDLINFAAGNFWKNKNKSDQQLQDSREVKEFCRAKSWEKEHPKEMTSEEKFRRMQEIQSKK